MEEGPSKWYSSYVMSESGHLQFVVIIDKGISAILDPVYHTTKVKLGDFLSVEIRKNPNAKSAQKAQHVVTDFKVIPPLANYVIENDERWQHVVIRTTARVVGSAPFHRKKIAILQNDIFGNFVDLESLVRLDAGEVEFDFKCKSSPLNSFASIFVPLRVIRYLPTVSQKSSDRDSRRKVRSESPGYPQTVFGFVGYDAGSHYWVYTRELKEDVFMKKDYGGDNQILTGKWVRMKVIWESDRRRKRVCDKVEIVDDVIESRMINGVPELFVDVIYEGEIDGSYPLFRSNEIGNVVDVEGIVDTTGMEMNEKLSGWVARHKWSSTMSRWKFSPKQTCIKSNSPIKIKKENFEEYENSAARSYRNIQERTTSSEESSDSDESDMFSDEEENRKKQRSRKSSESNSSKNFHVDYNSGRSRRESSSSSSSSEAFSEKMSTYDPPPTKSTTTNGSRNVLQSPDASSTTGSLSSEKVASEISSLNLKDTNRLKQILTTFMNDRDVRKAMKESDFEAYEEMEKIVKNQM